MKMVRENGRGKRPQMEPSVVGGGGSTLSTLLIKVSPTSHACNARKHHQFQDESFSTNRFLWGKDKVRNRFLVCPGSWSIITWFRVLIAFIDRDDFGFFQFRRKDTCTDIFNMSARAPDTICIAQDRIRIGEE